MPTKASMSHRGRPTIMTAAQFERVLNNSAQLAILIIGAVAVIAVLSIGQVILAPILLAVVIGMMFGPLADMLERRGIRPALSAGVVVLVLLGLIFIAGALFIGPLSEWVKRGPVLWEKLQTQLAGLQDQEEKLVAASQRLQAKVEAFRTKKETIKATYSAAEAQTKINEAFSGISEELGDVGLAVQRAEDKTAQMQARGQAIDELLASGALDDATGTSKDSITAELERMASTNDVESQLAAMKAEIGGAPAAPAIGSGAPAAAEVVTETEGQQQA